MYKKTILPAYKKKYNIGRLQYVFYSVLNTSYHLDLGVAAEYVTKSLMNLYTMLDHDHKKSVILDNWLNSGGKIIILKGYDHKHLKYIEKESKFMAIGTHALYQRNDCNTVLLVVSVFGQLEDLDFIFEGLSYL